MPGPRSHFLFGSSSGEGVLFRELLARHRKVVDEKVVFYRVGGGFRRMGAMDCREGDFRGGADDEPQRNRQEDEKGDGEAVKHV